MTKEELLVPRYKVILDFPYNPFDINDILIPFFVEQPDSTKTWYVQNNYDYGWINCEEYPAIFKKLEWWEERDINDLPEYVKCVNDLPYYYDHLIGAKILKDQVVKCEHTGHGEIIYMDTHLEIRFFEPSSKEEYEQQNK